MATPIFDGLSMRLSRRLNDPVSWAVAGAAGVDGRVFSNTTRQELLNRANADIEYVIFRRDLTAGKDNVRKILQTLIGKQTISALSSSGTAVATDYNNMPIYLARGTTAIHFYYPKKEDLDLNWYPAINNVFTIETGKIYAYSAGAVLNTGAASFYYIVKDEVTQNSSTDLLMPQTFHAHIVDLATLYGLRERGGQADVEKFWADFLVYLQTIGN